MAMNMNLSFTHLEIVSLLPNKILLHTSGIVVKVPRGLSKNSRHSQAHPKAYGLFKLSYEESIHPHQSIRGLEIVSNGMLKIASKGALR
jgi:hypothetical protein